MLPGISAARAASRAGSRATSTGRSPRDATRRASAAPTAPVAPRIRIDASAMLSSDTLSLNGHARRKREGRDKPAALCE